MPKIENVKVYGMEDSFRASKFPFAVDVNAVDDDLTKTIVKLSQCPIGEGHDNLLNGVLVQFDLTFSNKAWVELQRYHFIDFVSSQSTMHCVSRMDIKGYCNEYVTDNAIAEVERLKAEYLATPTSENYLRLLYNLPSGLELTARLTTNYRQLKTMYKQRRTHRLPDWQMFCDWVHTLPYSYLITGNNRV